MGLGEKKSIRKDPKIVIVPSKYLIRVPLKDKSYLVLYHSIFGGAVKVKKVVWNLIQQFKKWGDFPRAFNKDEVSAYRSTILDLKKRHFLVEKGTDEYALVEKENKKFDKSLAAGKCYIDGIRLEMASYCNFTCLHCFAPQTYDWKKGAKMSFHTAKLAVDGFLSILGKAGKKKGNITFWGGEPLLNWKVIKQVVEYVDNVTTKSAIFITFGIATNGSLLSDRILSFMKKHKMTAIVSLDGLQKENDRFRKFVNGKGTFKSIIKGIEGFSRYGIPFNVELCLNDYNFNSVERVIDYIYSNYRCNGFMIESINCQKGTPNFDRHSNQEKAKRIVEIYDYALKKGYSVSPADGVDLLDGAIEPTLYSRHNCNGLSNSLYVNPAGLVYNCHRITNPVIGTVERMEEIPKGNKYKHVAMRQMGRIKGCHGCEIEGFCKGGCAGVAVFYSGDIYNTTHPLFRSSYCDFYRCLFREMLKHRLGQGSFKAKKGKPR